MILTSLFVPSRHICRVEAKENRRAYWVSWLPRPQDRTVWLAYHSHMPDKRAEAWQGSLRWFKLTQLARGRARIQTQVCLSPNPKALLLHQRASPPSEFCYEASLWTRGGIQWACRSGCLWPGGGAVTSSFKGRSSVQAAAGWQFRPGLSWPYGGGWGISTGLELAARGPWSLKPFEDAGLGDRKPQCLNLASSLWFV